MTRWRCGGALHSQPCGATALLYWALILVGCVLVCQARQLLAFGTPQRLRLRAPHTSTATGFSRLSTSSPASPCTRGLRAAQSEQQQHRRRRPHLRRRHGTSVPPLLMWAQRGEARHNQLHLNQQQEEDDGHGSHQEEGTETTTTTTTITQSPNDVNGNKDNEGGRRKTNADKNKNKSSRKEEEKSVLGKVGDATKAAFNAVMAAATLASLLLAAETIWELHGTPLTFANALPTLTKLLPLTGIGVFGAAQLVGVVARVIRVIVTLPIMVSGTWVILQSVPQLLPKGSDLSGAGSLAAILATPEVLEAAAVLAFLSGMVIWAVNFTRGAVTALRATAIPTPGEDDDD